VAVAAADVQQTALADIALAAVLRPEFFLVMFPPQVA
jgi:hypothetical protein